MPPFGFQAHTTELGSNRDSSYGYTKVSEKGGSESWRERIVKQDELTHLSFFGEVPGGNTPPRPLNI